MNLGTRNIKKAGEIAQELANMRGRAVAVFIPATGVGGPLFEDSCHYWHTEEEWIEMQKKAGNQLYFPQKGYRISEYVKVKTKD